MKKVFLLCFVYSLSYAQTIETLIQKAYENNYNLKAMDKEVEISKQNSISSREWDNPTLSLGLSDLQLDDMTNRKKEPMQTQFIMLTQNIPLNNKKALSYDISIEKEKLSSINKDIQKAKIASIITTLSYKTLLQDKFLHLLEKKVANLKKMKSLTRAYQMDAEQSLFIELEMLKLQNKKESIKEKRESLLKTIEKLTLLEVVRIDESLDVKDISDLDISNHPKVKLLEQQIEVAKKESKLNKAKKVSDIKVSGGYYQRDARDDYMNISFSMPLAIGESENVEIVKSKIKIKKLQLLLKDTINSFENDIKILKQKEDKAIKNHDRYKKSFIPKQRKIIRLIKQKSSLNKATMIDVLKAKNSLFTLQELALKEIGEYFEAYGKLRYYR